MSTPRPLEVDTGVSGYEQRIEFLEKPDSLLPDLDDLIRGVEGRVVIDPDDIPPEYISDPPYPPPPLRPPLDQYEAGSPFAPKLPPSYPPAPPNRKFRNGVEILPEKEPQEKFCSRTGLKISFEPSPVNKNRIQKEARAKERDKSAVKVAFVLEEIANSILFELDNRMNRNDPGDLYTMMFNLGTDSRGLSEGEVSDLRRELIKAGFPARIIRDTVDPHSSRVKTCIEIMFPYQPWYRRIGFQFSNIFTRTYPTIDYD